MSKIFNWLQENLDKIAHAGMGTYISWLVASIIGLFVDEWEAPIFFGMVVASLVGFLKEVYDTSNKTGDAWDWVATVIGSILGALMWLI